MELLWTLVAWLAWLGIYALIRRHAAKRGEPMPIQWGWLAVITALVWGVALWGELT